MQQKLAISIQSTPYDPKVHEQILKGSILDYDIKSLIVLGMLKSDNSQASFLIRKEQEDGKILINLAIQHGNLIWYGLNVIYFDPNFDPNQIDYGSYLIQIKNGYSIPGLNGIVFSTETKPVKSLDDDNERLIIGSHSIPYLGTESVSNYELKQMLRVQTLYGLVLSIIFRMGLISKYQFFGVIEVSDEAKKLIIVTENQDSATQSYELSLKEFTLITEKLGGGNVIKAIFA